MSNRFLDFLLFRKKHSVAVDVDDEASFEDRLKPGGWSDAGFMGEDESLDGIIADDEELLLRLDVTYDQIADRIEYFIKNDWKYKFKIENSHLDLKEKNRLIIERISRFKDQESYDQTMVDGHFIIDRFQFKGFQECPWCEYIDQFCDSNYSVENTDLNERITFPGLIVHLIREHQFFEGKGTRYRVDPERAVRILEIEKI